MKVIYKYTLKPEEIQRVSMPWFSEILTVQVQDGIPQLWALVDVPTGPLVERKILMAGTGIEIKMNATLKYINTVQVRGGALVFHFFEIIE